MSDEEYVRSRWEPLYGPSCSYGGELRVLDGSHPSHTMRIGWANNFEELWSAAAAFTREHEEQIRLKEEEIDYVRGFTKLPDGTEHPVWQRILTRLQAQLTELKKGMK